MSVTRNVAKIIQDHVTFELECIDRMYLNVYVPALQCESGVLGVATAGISLPPPR